MTTSSVEYLGNLRTKCTHLASQTIIYTDAPVDNNGKGEAFSPTDLVATAYASCMITIMGIYCEANHIPFNSALAQVEKIMETNPRRIGKICIEIDLSANQWELDIAQKVIRAGKACPVAKTLDENVELIFEFKV
jgi:putative redox protein